MGRRRWSLNFELHGVFARRALVGERRGVVNHRSRREGAGHHDAIVAAYPAGGGVGGGPRGPEKGYMPQGMIAGMLALMVVAAGSSAYTGYKVYQTTDGRLMPAKSKR